MEKIAILLDSASDIEPEIAKENGFYLIPLYVNLNGEYYKDRIDITPDEFYEWIRENNTLPKTSMSSPGDVISIYEEIKNDGYDKLIVISIGEKFSGISNLFRMQEVPGLEVYVFDTGNLTLAQGFFAFYAKTLMEEGYTFDEIIEKLNQKKNDSHVYFTIDTFKYIIEGGRVPRTFGKIGDMLSVKPIITTDPIEGGFKLLKIVRGEKKAFKELYNIAEENLANTEKYYMFIAHGGYEKGVSKFEDVLREFIDRASMYFKVQISPTLGANTGPGLFGFGFFKLD